MKTSSKAIAAMVAIVTAILLYAFSWGITVGLIKLITICFGIKFKLAYATGIWLIICLIKILFNKSKDD